MKSFEELRSKLRRQEFSYFKPMGRSFTVEENKIIRMGVAPIRIEILTSISGVNFEECYQKKVVDEIDGIQVDIIDLRHLKINKKASGRHKDLDDFENLP